MTQTLQHSADMHWHVWCLV